MCTSNLTDWLTAIGTCGAVIVAILGKTIRNWFLRPKIEITCNQKEPCVSINQTETTSSDSDKEMTLRIKLVNKGRTSALHSCLNIDSYYKTREDGKYYVNYFIPIQMKLSTSTSNAIAPIIEYYYNIALIQKYDDQTSDGGEGKAKQFYKLYLLTGGKTNMELGKGSFLIPIKFYASNTGVVVKIISIYWKGKDLSIDKGSFEYKVLSETEFEKLTKEKIC